MAPPRFHAGPGLRWTSACRGLDIAGRVDHVINFDFPLNPLDFLHRTGRTARAGAAGRVTSLVAKRDRTLAQRIEQALAAGQPVDQLTGAPAGPARCAPPLSARQPNSIAWLASWASTSLLPGFCTCYCPPYVHAQQVSGPEQACSTLCAIW